jgi:hypothetical protein
MTAAQKNRLGQSLFFGLFFIVLGSLIRYWTEKGTAPYDGGRAAFFMGIVIVLWGVSAFVWSGKEKGKA